MRTLLRHAPTGFRVQSVDMWTGKRNEAFDFKLMGQAIRFAERASFLKMELVFVSDHLGGFTTVPLVRFGTTVSGLSKTR